MGVYTRDSFGQMWLRGLLLVVTVVAIAGLDTTSSDGDSVECVDINLQPAFLHPLLKHHKIQKSPSEIPKIMKTETKGKWRTQQAYVGTAECPSGTIPVRQYSDISTRGDAASATHKATHEYGIVYAPGALAKLYGAKATLNVWRPTVEREDEVSIAQIWIVSGSYEDNNLNTIEVGWQVYPALYHDNKTRLFIFWTSNTYTTGCYNLQCAGFIQTSSSIVIGGAITPISTFGGNQFEITISVWKDPKYGNWWLSLGSSLVGYWPAEILPCFADHAHEVQWGGEIVDVHSSDRHTKTQMGSGHFSDEGFSKASYFRNLEIVDSNNSFQPIQDLKETVDHPKSYDVKKTFREDWGRGVYFFYGGPGYSGRHSGGSSIGFSCVFLYFSFSIYFII